MDYDNPQFLAAVRKIIGDSLKPRVDSDDRKSNPADEGGDAPIAAIAELRTKIPISVKTKADDSKAERVWKWTKGTLEVFGILAVIVYTIVANKQWHEMISARHVATEAIRKTKESSDAQLAQLQSSFVADQRPYLWLTNDTGPFILMSTSKAPLTNKLGYNYHFMNYGKSPAIKVLTQGHIILGHNAIKKIALKPFDTQKGGIDPPGKDQFNTAVSDKIITDTTLVNKVNNGDVEFVVSGAMHYFDTAGNDYTSEFCLTRSPGGAIGYCDSHNSIK
jgi:hypothetical protein